MYHTPLQHAYNHQTTGNGWFVVFLNILSVHKHNKRSSSRAPSNQTISRAISRWSFLLCILKKQHFGIWLRCGNHIAGQSRDWAASRNIWKRSAQSRNGAVVQCVYVGGGNRSFIFHQTIKAPDDGGGRLKRSKRAGSLFSQPIIQLLCFRNRIARLYCYSFRWLLLLFQ